MPSLWKKPISLEEITRVHIGTTVAHLGIEMLEIGDDFLRARARR